MSHTYVLPNIHTEMVVSSYEEKIEKLLKKIDELTPKPKYSVGDEVLYIRV